MYIHTSYADSVSDNYLYKSTAVYFALCKENVRLIDRAFTIVLRMYRLQSNLYK